MRKAWFYFRFWIWDVWGAVWAVKKRGCMQVGTDDKAMMAYTSGVETRTLYMDLHKGVEVGRRKVFGETIIFYKITR